MAPARVTAAPAAGVPAAAEPPEARGLRRDEVRLLVSDVERGSIAHARFRDLPHWLSAGDLLVVNTSATMKAALDARASDGERFELHVSTRLPGGFWTVELREPATPASRPSRRAHPGMQLELPASGSALLLAPYPCKNPDNPEDPENPVSRLWLATLQLPEPGPVYFDRHGFPIRYSYVPVPWPIEAYQTVFATEAGSAEMPSAGRPFTHELVTRLVSHGVEIAPLVLHTGVASLEDHEPPYEERYRVPAQTAERVTAARRAGRRIIGVGTTVVRALETATDERGVTAAAKGWTNLVIHPDRPLRSVNAMITGLHEPKATHLAMLKALVGDATHLDRAYHEASHEGYLWHEFGDSHLILARVPRAL